MIRHLSSILILGSLVCSNSAQDNKMAETVKGLVKKLMDATVEGNYRAVLDLTHPKVLEMMGGKEAALNEIEKMMKTIKAQGFKFHLKDIGSPTFGKNGKEVYSVTPSSLVMTGRGKKNNREIRDYWGVQRWWGYMEVHQSG